MKYRIKVITFKNGRKEFYAEKKCWIGWTGLSFLGETGYSGTCSNRNEALEKIDRNFNGSAKKQTVEFEYIVK